MSERDSLREARDPNGGPKDCDTDDYPGAVWHRCARLADRLGDFAAWLTDNGADVRHDPKEAARLCVNRWDGLDMVEICRTLAAAEESLGLLIGGDDA